MTRNRIEAARAFIEGKSSPRSKGSVFTDGSVIWSYGTHFPMAFKLHSDRIAVNPDRYSRTTSGHQTALWGELARAGYHETGDTIRERVMGYEGDFEVWSR